MRIWLVNHYALPPGASGGPTRHLGLARALRDLGHDVVIHASIYDHYTRTDHRPRGASAHLLEEIEGITYVWWSTPRYGSVPARIRNMAAFASAFARRAASIGLDGPDVVLGSSPHLLAAWAARRVARQLQVPFVFEVRDLWPQTFVDMGELGEHNPLTIALRHLEGALYRSADRIITVLPGAAEYMISRGADPGAIVHIPNGVELGPAPPRTAASAGGELNVVYAGTLGHANGLELVVDTAAEIARRGRRDIRIRLVGAGPEREALQARAREIPDARISIDEAIPAEAVPELLASADVCLLVLRPSPVFRWGVSPTKLFDYLAAARPVVASVSAPDAIVGPAGAGIWAPAGEVAALADALAQLADLDPGRRDEMGARGRAYAEVHHGFDTLARSLIDVFEYCCRDQVAAP